MESEQPARLFRYVECMPLPNILTLYFKNDNLLLINRELFETLSDEQRQRVLRTEEKCLEVRHPPNKPPVVTIRGE